jgi:cellulose synthase/poly-beta-1,6-N-acetylglucosamine synthase-like glycosyltransferase
LLTYFEVKMTDYNNISLLVLFYIFASAAAVQLFYYFFFYLSVYLKEPYNKKNNFQPVSVIICARNEAENLKNFLPAVLEQDYADYEVIVVNDCSEDNSYAVLAGFLKKYPHLRISTINKDPNFSHNKKFAQFIGIKAAKNEILLFTDADCKPESNKWLEGMTAHFEEKIDFVLGYGGYLIEKGMLNKYIRYDSFTNAIQYLGMAIRGVPYMGVGRNLSYRRSVFFENKGFGSHNHVVSGDDDLLVNTIAKRGNTHVEYSLETHTRSIPASTFNNWINQKKRHLATAPYYKARDKFLLITEPFTRLLFYSALIILLSFLFLWPWVLAVFGLRLITQITVFSLDRKKLNEPGLLAYLLIFDIFSPLINGIILLSNNRIISGKNRWK